MLPSSLGNPLKLNAPQPPFRACHRVNPCLTCARVVPRIACPLACSVACSLAPAPLRLLPRSPRSFASAAKQTNTTPTEGRTARNVVSWSVNHALTPHQSESDALSVTSGYSVNSGVVGGEPGDPDGEFKTVKRRSKYGNFDIILGRFSRVSQLHVLSSAPTHTVCYALRSAHADRVLVGAWNPMS